MPSVQRLDGAETFYAPSRTNGAGHLITIHNGHASCTCPAKPATCWAVRELMARVGEVGVGPDALIVLGDVARDRAILAVREATAVASARSDGVSWHRIAVALGRTTEGVRRRYRSAS